MLDNYAILDSLPTTARTSLLFAQYHDAVDQLSFLQVRLGLLSLYGKTRSSALTSGTDKEVTLKRTRRSSRLNQQQMQKRSTFYYLLRCGRTRVHLVWCAIACLWTIDARTTRSCGLFDSHCEPKRPPRSIHVQDSPCSVFSRSPLNTDRRAWKHSDTRSDVTNRRPNTPLASPTTPRLATKRSQSFFLVKRSSGYPVRHAMVQISCTPCVSVLYLLFLVPIHSTLPSLPRSLFPPSLA